MCSINVLGREDSTGSVALGFLSERGFPTTSKPLNLDKIGYEALPMCKHYSACFIILGMSPNSDTPKLLYVALN